MATKKKTTFERRIGRGRGVSMPADWGSVDAELLRRAIAAASGASGALRFGYTQDAGAYALGIYGDGPDPYTEYVRPGDDVEVLLTDIAEVFEEMAAKIQ
jgi:hypothetical protein